MPRTPKTPRTVKVDQIDVDLINSVAGQEHHGLREVLIHQFLVKCGIKDGLRPIRVVAPAEDTPPAESQND